MIETAGYSFGVMIGLVTVLIYLVAKSSYSVDAGCIAILTSFGKLRFVDEKKRILATYGPGFHFKWFWERITILSMMEQCLDLTAESEGITAMAKDGTVLKINCRLRYFLVQNELYDFLFRTRDAEEHLKEIFICLLRSEIAGFSSPQASVLTDSSSYAQIRQERRVLNNELEIIFKAKIYSSYGIKFQSVDLLNILPPEELALALNAVVNAQSEAEALLSRAEAECEQRIISAEKGVEIAVAKSSATEIEVTTIGCYLKELKEKGKLADYVERRKAEIFHDVKNAFIKI